MTDTLFDAVVIGSGPNGLAAAATLVKAGKSVCVLEARDTIGGGLRTAELTVPGFLHDVCSAVHPMGQLSPLFCDLPLKDHGLDWCEAPVSVAHPLDGGKAALLAKSFEKTALTLGPDGDRWEQLIKPFLKHSNSLFEDILAPLRIPKHPLTMLRLGWYGWRSAVGLSRSAFRGDAAQALLAGCAGHSILPLNKLLTSAVGLVFAISAHLVDWACAKGGSQSIADALTAYIRSQGGVIRVGHPVSSMSDLPSARTYLFDTSPRGLSQIAADALPVGYRNRLARYRYGPAVFKVNWSLKQQIPWEARECATASTVHVGGTMKEIAASEQAMWNGKHSDSPFLILCQQSHFDDTRAPGDAHTGYAYCHVPANSDVDMTQRIEAQVERFAPGFKDTIVHRHVQTPNDFQQHNANYVGGAVTGGVADLFQLFTRPVTRWNPYTTPNPRIFICSASSPPGGGVHGMCGYWAAQAALKRLG